MWFSPPAIIISKSKTKSCRKAFLQTEKTSAAVGFRLDVEHANLGEVWNILHFGMRRKPKWDPFPREGGEVFLVAPAEVSEPLVPLGLADLESFSRTFPHPMLGADEVRKRDSTDAALPQTSFYSCVWGCCCAVYHRWAHGVVCGVCLDSYTLRLRSSGRLKTQTAPNKGCTSTD